MSVLLPVRPWPPSPAAAALAARLQATFDLQRFAAEDEGRTEDPTARKYQKARERGQVAKSQELPLAAGILAGFIGLYFYLPWVWMELAGLMRWCLSPAVLHALDPGSEPLLLLQVLWQFLRLSAPAFAIAVLTGIAVNLAQVGFLFTLEPLRPRPENLLPSPKKLMQRMIFSKQVAMNLLKSLFKLVVITWLAYAEISGSLAPMLDTINSGVMSGTLLFLDAIMRFALKTGVFLLLLAFFDLWFQKREHKEQLKMTKQETKDEMRSQDGDPQIKQHIRKRAREIAMTKRMFEALPTADVVITNPTHYAVALAYLKLDPQPSAPTVVAKGHDALALRLREVAQSAGVPVCENPPLARALYAEVDLGATIPEQHFGAVVDILRTLQAAAPRAAAG